MTPLITPPVDRALRLLTGAWMPWLGKRFDAGSQIGDNTLTNSTRLVAKLLWPLYSTQEYGSNRAAFDFETRVEPGKNDPDRDVLVIDYFPVDSNPRFIIRQIRDELVEIVPGANLGKILWRSDEDEPRADRVLRAPQHERLSATRALAKVRLEPDPKRREVPRTGAVESVQRAEVDVPRSVIGELWRRENLERLARAYWRYLSRISLGLIRVVYEPEARTVVLVWRRLALLRFGRPRVRRGRGARRRHVADRPRSARLAPGTRARLPPDHGRARGPEPRVRTIWRRCDSRSRSRTSTPGCAEAAGSRASGPGSTARPSCDPRPGLQRVPALARRTSTCRHRASARCAARSTPGFEPGRRTGTSGRCVR